MENPKRHKRSGSASISKPAASSTFPRRKKSLSGKFGKFQGGKVKTEKKNIDVDITATATTLPLLSAPPGRVLLNPINTGTSPNQAVGRRVVMHSLLLRMTIAQPTVSGVTTVGPTGCRVIAVYDHESNGALPAAADIMQALGAGSSALMNLNNSERFTVLLDEKFTFGQIVITGAPASAVSAPTTYMVDRYVKLKLDAVANGAFTGAIAGILTGSVILMAWSDSATNPPQIISGYSRIRYTDT